MKNKDYINIFKVLSDDNRLKIVQLIHNKKEVCVCELIKHFNITQPTFSYHMKLLKDAQIVECTKIGTMCHYRLNYKTINKLTDIIN